LREGTYIKIHVKIFLEKEFLFYKSVSKLSYDGGETSEYEFSIGRL